MKVKITELIIAYILALWWIVIMGAATLIAAGWLGEPKGFAWGIFVGMFPMGMGHRWLAGVFERKLKEDMGVTDFKGFG